MSLLTLISILIIIGAVGEFSIWLIKDEKANYVYGEYDETKEFIDREIEAINNNKEYQRTKIRIICFTLIITIIYFYFKN